MTIYVEDCGNNRGLWLDEGGGILISPRSGLSNVDCISELSGGFELSVKAASQRLIRQGEPGGRIHFTVPSALAVQTVTRSMMRLLLGPDSNYSRALVLQRKRNQVFSIPSSSNICQDIEWLRHSPIVVQLASPRISSVNCDRYWHRNLAFRIFADRFNIERPDYTQRSAAA